MYTLSIDPGLSHAGLALWRADGTLVQAWLARAKNSVRAALEDRFRALAQAVGGGDVETVVIEKPQVYRHSKGDPNDLINLAVMVGVFAHVYAPAAVVTYLPREWKGSVKKEAMVKHIQGRLSEAERTRVETKPPSLAHNVWDAVGIGLHYFKRLK